MTHKYHCILLVKKLSSFYQTSIYFVLANFIRERRTLNRILVLVLKITICLPQRKDTVCKWAHATT